MSINGILETGIGGVSVTNKVALIPVCFGQRPGMIRAAILEDTPNAPFLLSLPILKALNTWVNIACTFKPLIRWVECFTMRRVSFASGVLILKPFVPVQAQL